MDIDAEMFSQEEYRNVENSDSRAVGDKEKNMRHHYEKYMMYKNMADNYRRMYRYYNMMAQYHYQMWLHYKDGSDMPSMPNIDNNMMPGMDGMMPGMDYNMMPGMMMPGMGGMPMMMPGMGDDMMPGMNNMPMMPGMNNMSMMPGMNNMQTMPGMNTMPNMNNMPGVGGQMMQQPPMSPGMNGPMMY